MARILKKLEVRDRVQGAYGTLAGGWFASPATVYAEELIAAGLLLLARPVGGDQITEWNP
jgi:hypothetical protein